MVLHSSKHISKSADYDFLHPWLGTGQFKQFKFQITFYITDLVEHCIILSWVLCPSWPHFKPCLGQFGLKLPQRLVLNLHVGFMN